MIVQSSFQPKAYYDKLIIEGFTNIRKGYGKMKRKIIIALIILVLIVLCLGFVFHLLKISSKDKETKIALEIYGDFLEGDTYAYNNTDKSTTINIMDIIVPTGEPEKRYRTEYAFFDMNDDGIPECHVKSSRYYNIFTIYEGEIYRWRSEYPQTDLLNNGDLLYKHVGGANYHEEYNYMVVDKDGETELEVFFGWGDNNNNTIIDVEDYFYFLNENEISMEEWMNLTEKYMTVGMDDIQWILLQEEGTTEEVIGGNDYIERDFLDEDLLQWMWVIKPQEYKDIIFMDDEFIGVQNFDDKWAIMTVDGEQITDFQYDSITGFHDGIAVINRNIYINKECEVVLENTYEVCRSFSEKRSAVLQDGKWGFIDIEGNLVIPPLYDEVGWFNNNVVPVKLNNKWGVIDSSGNVILDCVYDAIRDYQDGYAAVMMNKKWGFVDTEGNLCIECMYAAVGNFSERKAAVLLDENEHLWAYINPRGETVIEPYSYSAIEGKMIYAGEFHDGIAFVSKDLYCIIDDEGNNVFLGDSIYFISALTYNSEYNIIPGYAFLDKRMTERKYGFMGLHGEVRTEPVFDYIDDMNGKYNIVSNIIDEEYYKGLIEFIP